MALGNEIILTPEPRGRRLEGVIEGGLKPGTVVQIKPGSVADAGNRETYQAWDTAGTGVPGLIAILDYDYLQGKTADDAIPDGKRGFVYYPLPGDELNMLVQDQSGTGATSDFAVGDLMAVEDGTGLLIDGSVGTSTNASAPFQVVENYSDMSGDTRLKVMFTGY